MIRNLINPKKMKKIITLLTFFLLISCSSDDTEETPTNIQDLNVTFTVGNTDLVIDEKLTITLQSNKSMHHIQIFIDGVRVIDQVFSGFNANSSFYFDYDTLGSKTIKFKVWSDENEAQVVEKTVNVSVTRGNAIKITKAQIISFTNIDGTWDSEYADTDINRLADVLFALEKRVTRIYEDGSYFSNFLISTVKENQGDLTWDLSSENLFLNPNKILRLNVADIDTDFNQSLLDGFTRDISFSEYIETQPSTITVSYPSIHFEMILDIEW